MIIKYKLTNKKGKTHKDFQWPLPKDGKPGEWVEMDGDVNQPLCTNNWLHCYDHPFLAVLHNPIHANIENPILWKVECAGKSKNDRGIKCGYQKMRLLKRIRLPKITTTQKIAYGILCTVEVCKDKKFLNWARGWLNGENRTQAAAEEIAFAVYAAAPAAVVYVAYAAVYTSAAFAALAIARAVYSADLDLIKIAKQAMKIK